MMMLARTRRPAFSTVLLLFSTRLLGRGQMLLVGWLAGAGLLCLPHPARVVAAESSSGRSARVEVAADLRQLHDWLDRYPQGGDWRRYLLSDELLEQIERGESAAPEQLREILDRYASGRKGLDGRRFVAVREALERWLAELPEASAESLVERIRQAAEEFRPVTEEDVATARGRLEQALTEFQSWLATTTAENRAGWRQYLELEQLENQLEVEGKPDLRVLSQVLWQFYQNEEGLESEPFLELRAALRRYRDVVLFNSPALKKAYADQLKALAGHLEAFEANPTASDRVAIGQILGWLERAGQVPDIVRAVRQRFDYPNFLAQVSERFVVAGFHDRIDEVAPVHQTILGTVVRGTSHTVGTVVAQLVPDDERAAIQLRLNATALSDNVGYNRGVRIYSNGRTRIAATKMLYVDGPQLLQALGFDTLPALADCDTDTRLEGVAASCGLVRHIAWSRAQQSKGQAERIASRNAEERVERQVDQQARDLLADLRQRLRQRIRGPLQRLNALPDKLRLRSTARELFVRLVQTNAEQVAASTPPPPPVTASDVALQLHETMVGNLSESLLGNRTVTDEDIREWLEENDREVPEALAAGDPWSITFQAEQPVQVGFQEDGIRIALRGRRFTGDRRSVSDNIEISAVYQVERGPEGTILKRPGDVVVDYVGQPSLRIQQVAFKRFLQSKFQALFEETIPIDDIELAGRWKDAGRLTVASAEAADGWFNLAWRLTASPTTTPVAAAATVRLD